MKRFGVTAVLATGVIIGACAEVESAYETMSAKMSGLWDEVSAPFSSPMTEEDERLAAAAVQDALENGLNNATLSWSNEDTGHSGKVTPVKTYMTEAGVFCRDYHETILIGGSEESSLKAACRDEAGIWQSVD